jgi:alkylation response protein AidB-like acyl-CoA dehydrogenase
LSAGDRAADSEHALAVARRLADEFAATYAQRDAECAFPHAEVAALKRSGLLAAAVPAQHGGWGVPFATMVEITRTLAQGNPSVAQVFAASYSICMHHLRDLDAPEVAARVFREVVARGALVTNASSERHPASAMIFATTFTPDGAGYRIHGEKFFCTGSLGADLLYVVGMTDGRFQIAFLPPDAPGVEVVDDWRAMGQRGTASGTVRLRDAWVSADWVVSVAADLSRPDPRDFFGPMNQTYFSAVYLGTAAAALAHAHRYIVEHGRPWYESGVARAAEDPLIQVEYGRLAARLAAAEALLRAAAGQVEALLDARAGLEEAVLLDARTAVMMEVAKTKVVATETALDVTQGIFKLMGARATLAALGSDRYWRDVRTLTLHDPVDYKARMVGARALTGVAPPIGFLS